MERGSYVDPDRSLKAYTKFKGEVTYNEINFSPSTAKPGDILNVEFPRRLNELIIPGSFALCFDLEIVLDPAAPGNDVKTYPVNNLAANIIREFKVKIGSTSIFDLNYAYLYNTFKDLWLTGEERINLVGTGIQDIQLRKLRTDLNTNLVKESTILKQNIVIQKLWKKRYQIPIRFEMITHHMPLSGELLDEILLFEIKINDVSNVLNYENKSTANFEMKNICLEYETFKDAEHILYKKIKNKFISGISFLFDDVHHIRRTPIKNDNARINEEIKLSRGSLKGILFLFEPKFADGVRDSEKFINPTIKNIIFTIDGVPNSHYSSGMKETNHWPAICKHFMPEEVKLSQNCIMNLPSYYAHDKFALWIDLRSTEDNNLRGTGKAQQPSDTIAMEIEFTKTDNGIDEYIMHIFAVSDARVIIKDRRMLRHDLVHAD